MITLPLVKEHMTATHMETLKVIRTVALMVTITIPLMVIPETPTVTPRMTPTKEGSIWTLDEFL